MGSVNISVDKLREMLAAAYEAGWYGSLELKEQVAEDLIKDFESSNPVPDTFPSVYAIYNAQPISVSVGPGMIVQVNNPQPLHPDAWQNAGDG